MGAIPAWWFTLSAPFMAQLSVAMHIPHTRGDGPAGDNISITADDTFPTHVGIAH